MEELKRIRDELVSAVRKLDYEDIPKKYLDGINDVKRHSVNFGGHYTSSSSEGVYIKDKDGLTLTLKIPDLEYEYYSEDIFSMTDECENGMEFKDWDGTFKYTIEESDVHLLMFLLGSWLTL